MVIDEKTKARFFAKVNKDSEGGCWLWTGAKRGHGYGGFRIGHKKFCAARVSWTIAYGPIPPGPGYHGTCVLHRCDVPACVRPKHLFLGTHKDNLHDASLKGRMHFGDRNGSRTHPERICRGESQPAAKLNARTVREVRQRASAGERQRALAAEFGVSQQTISKVARRQAWRHVPEEVA